MANFSAVRSSIPLAAIVKQKGQKIPGFGTPLHPTDKATIESLTAYCDLLDPQLARHIFPTESSNSFAGDYGRMNGFQCDDSAMRELLASRGVKPMQDSARQYDHRAIMYCMSDMQRAQFDRAPSITLDQVATDAQITFDHMPRPLNRYIPDKLTKLAGLREAMGDAAGGVTLYLTPNGSTLKLGGFSLDSQAAFAFFRKEKWLPKDATTFETGMPFDCNVLNKVLMRFPGVAIAPVNHDASKRG